MALHWRVQNSNMAVKFAAYVCLLASLCRAAIQRFPVTVYSPESADDADAPAGMSVDPFTEVYHLDNPCPIQSLGSSVGGYGPEEKVRLRLEAHWVAPSSILEHLSVDQCYATVLARIRAQL